MNVVIWSGGACVIIIVCELISLPLVINIRICDFYHVQEIFSQALVANGISSV